MVTFPGSAQLVTLSGLAGVLLSRNEVPKGAHSFLLGGHFLVAQGQRTRTQQVQSGEFPHLCYRGLHPTQTHRAFLGYLLWAAGPV